ncbi:MAG: FG-GAP repeat protein [Deltaproteobacteria bacterium]|nr:FG-GAP repeat protein [Deltaproteobacteria bacterium]
MPSGEVEVVEARIEIARPELGLVEWFVNSDAGLEQGFTLSERPTAATHATKPGPTSDRARRDRQTADLVLELAVSGARASLRGESVRLASDAGRAFEYGKLAVVDARGVALAARFEVPSADRIRLVVDDAGATYPIVIDPLLESTDDGQISADLASAFMGSSVSSAGDVNGDGFDDVIVGARNYDGGSSGIGAAFVFLGSAAGLGDGSPANAHAQLSSNQGVPFLTPLFGASVAAAGDVNGDGYGDVIVGSSAYAPVSGGSGAAFVFLGSETGIADGSPATAAARIVIHDFDESGLGTSVASAGDVNGDGFDDVIVGAPGYNAVIINEGAAFVYLGSAAGIADATTATAHARLSSDQGGFIGGSVMGQSVASAGDVNADGYDDVIVGAPLYTAGQGGEGAAFVFLGSASGIPNGTPATAHAQLESDQVNASLGFSVSSAGDVNGDGYADVVVGAPGYDRLQTNSNEGEAFVFHGSSTGLTDGNPLTADGTVLDPMFLPGPPGAAFGSSVASAGDLNGDGFGDLIVGARSYFPNGLLVDEGAFIVVSGGASGIHPFNRYRLVESNQAGARMGNSVASAGDVDGDGFDDLIVGAELWDGGQSDEGAAFVYHGGAFWFDQSEFPLDRRSRFEADQVDAELGWSVASAGDVNGDGYGDVIVGAPAFDAGEVDEGAAFLFLGPVTLGLALEPATPVLTAHARFESNQIFARMGESVASAGDYNGDGYGDVVVGAPFYDFGPGDEGYAFLYLGSPAGMGNGDPDSAAVRFESVQSLARMGSMVASAGDVNGDGYGDVIVGAPFYDSGESDEGAAFVYHGGPPLSDRNPTSSNGRLESDQVSARMGASVGSAGDVNGDGYGDVIVGAPRFDFGFTDEGAAFVFLGSPTGIGNQTSVTAHARFVGNRTSAALGSRASVASAGDVNADGFDDVIIGAPDYDGAASRTGAAFLFEGSSTGLSNGSPETAATRFESSHALDHLGASVASAGDVNRDGYGDVVVGAPSESAINGQGAIYVLLGSSEGIPDGNAETTPRKYGLDVGGGSWGWSVASAGDVNGDGTGDLIAGAPTFESGDPTAETDEGAVFVLLQNWRGDPVLAQQRRGDASGIPVQAGGSAHAPDRFEVELLARSPRGRERAKLEIEVCPAGVSFGAVVCHERISPVWIDLGTSGAVLAETVTGLASNTSYAWRARIHYAEYSSTQVGIQPTVRIGPWFRLQGRAANGDIRTVPEPGVGLGLMTAIVLSYSFARRRRVA